MKKVHKTILIIISLMIIILSVVLFFTTAENRFLNNIDRYLTVNYYESTERPARIINRMLEDISNSRRFNTQQKEEITRIMRLRAAGLWMDLRDFPNVRDTPQSALTFAGVQYHLDFTPAETIEIWFKEFWNDDFKYDYDLINEYIWTRPLSRLEEDTSLRAVFENYMLEKIIDFLNLEEEDNFEFWLFWLSIQMNNPDDRYGLIDFIKDNLETMLEERNSVEPNSEIGYETN